MGNRKRIAFLYTADYNNNTGVVIYLQNIIKHFLALKDAMQPDIILLYSANSPIIDLKILNYPYAKYICMDKVPPLWVRALNKFSRVLFNRLLFRPSVKADLAFPAYPLDILRGVKHRIYWKEDFQENYYPHFFSDKSFEFVKQFFMALQAYPQQKLVLSSFSAKDDLKRFYPEVSNPVYIFRFVSLLPQMQDEQIQIIRSRLRLDDRYFITCNQFWPHKNHMLVLEAVHLLNNAGHKGFKVVLTGKTTSNRDVEYFPALLSYIKDHALEQSLVITDFLSREDQLLLMKNAIAVIQPSLFEGWSTVIEDAKALNKYILAADLPVNREQVTVNVSFFEKHSAEQLAVLMQTVLEDKIHIEVVDYSIQIEDCRKSLVTLFELAPQ